MPVCNGIFEGGGVRGIGFAGAIYALEKAGYNFDCVGGTSAGGNGIIGQQTKTHCNQRIQYLHTVFIRKK